MVNQQFDFGDDGQRRIGQQIERGRDHAVNRVFYRQNAVLDLARRHGATDFVGIGAGQTLDGRPEKLHGGFLGVRSRRAEKRQRDRVFCGAAGRDDLAKNRGDGARWQVAAALFLEGAEFFVDAFFARGIVERPTVALFDFANGQSAFDALLQKLQ